MGKEIQGLSIGSTRTGTVAGAPTHMAPEQFDDAKHVDVRADIYSFGIMLFQMITGKLPFVGRKWQEFKHLHQTQALPSLPNSLPSPLITVVTSCLAKDPARRFADFSTLRERLAELYEGLTGARAPQPVMGAELGVALDAVRWKLKGSSLGNLGRPEEALVCFDDALALDPRDADAWYSKGAALGNSLRHREALACFEEAQRLGVPYAAQAIALCRQKLGR